MPYVITKDSFRTVEDRKSANLQPGETFSMTLPDDVAEAVRLGDAVFAANQRLSEYMEKARNSISLLQAYVDIGEATQEQEALLLAWKKHLAALGKVKAQAGWPEEIDWPEPPPQ